MDDDSRRTDHMRNMTRKKVEALVILLRQSQFEMKNLENIK
jgi:hypothetical protein